MTRISSRPTTPSRIIHRVSMPVPVHVDCVSKEALENLVDHVMEAQAEDIKILEEDLADERQRTDEDIRRLGINDNILRRDLRKLKERTKSLEQDSKDILLATALNRAKTPPPVIINNNCTHRPVSKSSRRYSDSSSDGDTREFHNWGPRGPPPPGPGRSDAFTNHIENIPEAWSPPFMQPPLSPMSASSPLGNLGLGVASDLPDSSIDDGGSSGFTTASEAPSPRTAPRRHSIEYHPVGVPPLPPRAVPLPRRRGDPRVPRMVSRHRTPNRNRTRFAQSSTRPVFAGEGNVYDIPPNSLIPESPESDLPGMVGGESIFRRSGGRVPFEDHHQPFRQFRGQNIGPQPMPPLNGPIHETPTDNRRPRRMSGQFMGMRDLEFHGEIPRRRGSAGSTHVRFAPSDQFQRFSPPQFNPGSIHENHSPSWARQDRRASGNGMRKGPTWPIPSELFSDIDTDLNYDPDRIRGSARRTSSTVAESPYVMDEERDRYLDRMARMGEMETIHSQDTESDMGRRGREGSGESGVGRDGRYRYDRYRQFETRK
ncbi:hypothetical protein TWF694_006805 [Orbilia ellipsospora]|uniref:Uncharacterized protein n=1 Tax=Orbilia ellipsospora TaxID=2528407 RepID=A0AAV9XLN8_9PEZI